ncbi:HGGxSTG domain-containing protein [Alicyclobacillus sp. ALC3]|uniref:HGGxSTG domain-containing protein n=1 Tax=Alicyclobacillus sp. ALC3 TaxID=2796143 RepID=UPI0023782728|nr:HGGxSTG domain-containing protein [Alicyclobacillus sp. ALC3]WDL98138.1 hypothetical protein JC200_05400 [Alicyclobacillus sp. ALC3]
MPLCGAKTRDGHPCKNHSMKNNRCRMHGGKSTGAPPEKMKGNKNAVTTGEHESIWMDAFDDTERQLYGQVDVDAMQQIENEIRLLDIRERRMLLRIKKLADGPAMTIATVDRSELSNRQVGQSKGTNTRLESVMEQIQRIEEALTRVQERKAKFIALRHQIEFAEWKKQQEEKKMF